jgi:hypothetical protein
MPHPEWYSMSDQQKLEFLYEWSAQTSMVVQELRTMTQTLMDKVIQVEITLTSMTAPPSA